MALIWLSRAAKADIIEAASLIADRVALDCAGSAIHQYLEPCQRVAALGIASGHCALGKIYSSQISAADCLDKAEAAYRTAAQAGHIPAARELGMLLARQSKPDEGGRGNNARHWLQMAAVAGDQQAVRALAELLWRAGDREILCNEADKEKAQRGAYWLERAVRKGHGRATWRYGRLHVRDFRSAPTGLPHSFVQASRLLERAAAAGVSEALWDLARIYKMEGFSRRDIHKARDYLEKAANAGICEAELELGKHLARYKNDRPMWIAAGRWLSRAAEAGLSEASVILERISTRAPDWPPAVVLKQTEILENIRDEHPIVAARLELAARFGLTARETLFINPLNADHGWCLEVDLCKYFKQKLWRLVTIDSADQRLALERACAAFLAPGKSNLDLRGLSTRTRAFQMEAILLPLLVDISWFVRNWKAQYRSPDSPNYVLQRSEDFQLLRRNSFGTPAPHGMV